MQIVLFLVIPAIAMSAPQRTLYNVDQAFYQPSAAYPGGNIGHRPPPGAEPISIGPEFVNPSFVNPGVDPVHVVDNNPGGQIIIPNPDPFFAQGGQGGSGYQPVSIGPTFVTGTRPYPSYSNSLLRDGK